ncbi:MAG: acyl carrier protein [Longimicrobiales bacterium]
MSFRDRLIRFIETDVVGKDDASIEPEQSLLDDGLMDSIGLLRVIAFVESETGVRIPDARVTPINFESVVAIESLVAELRDS